MPRDFASVWLEPKPGIEFLDFSYSYVIREMPKVGTDYLMLPSHIYKYPATVDDVVGCLFFYEIDASTYRVASAYYASNSGLNFSYGTNPQEGRQLIYPADRIEGWIKDAGGVWHRLGYTTGCKKRAKQSSR
ncbi:MAG: hypothetical protein QMC85_07385 [Methanocellales archaeon]|nr:hypothetical protein [Methanocellales archaeon]